jgi:hypothetical protein
MPLFITYYPALCSIRAIKVCRRSANASWLQWLAILRKSKGLEKDMYDSEMSEGSV